MAVELNAPITADDFRMLNKGLDDAIGAAVTVWYEQEQDLDDVAAGESELLAVLARDLGRN